MTDIPKVYDASQVEAGIYKKWLENGYFKADAGSKKPGFVIVMPPPNVTGNLHMGHALDNTIQDVLIRWKRMSGYEALWVPGTDHASIATQHKIEEKLAKEGITRWDLGREKFLEKAWEWKERYEANILNQLKRLGASCDWSRTRFTMDEGCSRAVLEVFTRLYKKGLIYRGQYITNWCPECNTVISDIEVEYREDAGKLYYVRYPAADGDGYIVVATTRPETMPGDVAVAVHPQDERYRRFVGRRVILPPMGREIPVIADEYADPNFGTGAVKVTPGHDPSDFEAGKRHGLPIVNVMDKNGRMNQNAGKYAGMTRDECRATIVKFLGENGYLEKVEDYKHSVGHCYRCGSTVEPLVSEQWFVKMKPLAEPAIRAVKEGRIKFVPERFDKIYLNWMENIRDWCISRQLWWGHRIPAWYCKDCGEMIVQTTAPEKCPGCGGVILEQDPDVLDTWFSSALWPFSTLGWPDDTEDLRRFYPTSVLVTGYDIIFFWVARMILMGIEFTGSEPFEHVLVHGLVRDALGRKMSKSLGNGIDPLEVIDKYGADALRFSLITGNTPGNDMRFSWEKAEGARNFCNKIWNAARFVAMNLEGFNPLDIDSVKLEVEDTWIEGRFETVCRAVNAAMQRYELGEAARELYDFFWGDFCDWYIEMVKPRLALDEGNPSKIAARYTLWRIIEGSMRLLHPFMPFITEEIWGKLPHEGEALIVARYPVAPDVEKYEELYGAVTRKISSVQEVVRAIRNMRQELNVQPGREVQAIIRVADPDYLPTFKEFRSMIENLSDSKVQIQLIAGEARMKKALSSVVSGGTVYLPLEGLVDPAQEIARVKKAREEALIDFERSKQRLSNQGFLQKAPPEVVEKERANYAELEARIRRLDERLGVLNEL
ncbi:MAG TPA: valine--tRNA ligase [Firmicutes bacterium]|nr:valine--tRNA ligase [Bacillota bacterium]